MDYWHKRWICPFFKWDEMLEIGCEGGRRLRFKKKDDICGYVKGYCASEKGWESCSIAKQINEYYQGEK